MAISPEAVRETARATAGAGHILLSDDETAVCEIFSEALLGRGFDVAVTHTAEEALERLQAEDFDVVVTDLNFDGMDGLELCAQIVANRPGVPVIVVTGFGSLDTAVGAIRAGAYDFVTKPVHVDAFLLAVNRALQYKRLDAELKRLRAEVEVHECFDSMIGSGEAMRKVFDLVRRAADSDASVLVTGESGTGKELVARALHRSSPRKHGPFVAVDCASIPSTILESELFGHARGAFTDAKADRRGLFAQADGGTLFLDEIGEMPLEMQAKLLRALQERRVRPVGSNTEVRFDARLITATNRDLEGEVAEGRFREDLYYRINVVRIQVPPLRARSSDVLLLAQHFLVEVVGRSTKKIDGFVHAAAEKMLAYDWPGNVRELMNCVEAAVALARHDKITLDDLPQRIREYRVPELVSSIGADPKELVPMTEIEQRYIKRVLTTVGGNRTHAAKILGIERRTLYRKLKN